MDQTPAPAPIPERTEEQKLADDRALNDFKGSPAYDAHVAWRAHRLDLQHGGAL